MCRLLLRIDLDADNDYSRCLQVSLVDNPFTPQAYDLSSLVYAYSGQFAFILYTSSDNRNVLNSKQIWWLL